jgi:aspartate/methionine/tyrosine aminotransferase
MDHLTNPNLPGIPSGTTHMRSHYTGAQEHLRNDSPELRGCSAEQVIYHEYREAGFPHGPAMYAVKGEHWNGVSPGFLDFLNNFKFTREDMGYAECGYGIQRHRDFMHKLIITEHDLKQRRPNPALEIDVGCLAMTTRMAMYDLAKVAYRASKTRWPEHKPIALVPTPAWDYRGIFKDVGFDIVYLPIRPHNGWLPNLAEWNEIVSGIRKQPQRHIALAVSNPQHNPTGMQWPAEVTQFLLDICTQETGYLLIDDAYYNVHDPRVPVVNHLKALLTLFDQNGGNNLYAASGMFDRWVATRPFGKQFSCNTMGVAAITTSPTLLRQLNRESWINRYHCNTHNAEVMCAWLAQPEAQDWTIETGLLYARQKERVRDMLVRELGWPWECVCVGPSTSYLMFEIPKVYQLHPEDIDKFRDDLFYATGTMISASLFNQNAPAPYVRLHLGSHPDVIEEFLRRWRVAGLNYHQSSLFPGKAALTRPIPPQLFRQLV